MTSYSTIQAAPQFPHRIRVTHCFRDNPVASIDTPSVNTAPAAFPPLTPRFTRNGRDTTWPRT